MDDEAPAWDKKRSIVLEKTKHPDRPVDDIFEPITASSAAQLVAKLRKHLNLSQDEVSERTGVTQPTISRIENDYRTATVVLLQRICKGCGFELVLSVIPTGTGVVNRALDALESLPDDFDDEADPLLDDLSVPIEDLPDGVVIDDDIDWD